MRKSLYDLGSAPKFWTPNCYSSRICKVCCTKKNHLLFSLLFCLENDGGESVLRVLEGDELNGLNSTVLWKEGLKTLLGLCWGNVHQTDRIGAETIKRSKYHFIVITEKLCIFDFNWWKIFIGFINNYQSELLALYTVKWCVSLRTLTYSFLEPLSLVKNFHKSIRKSFNFHREFEKIWVKPLGFCKFLELRLPLEMAINE